MLFTFSHDSLHQLAKFWVHLFSFGFAVVESGYFQGRHFLHLLDGDRLALVSVGLPLSGSLDVAIFACLAFGGVRGFFVAVRGAGSLLSARSDGGMQVSLPDILPAVSRRLRKVSGHGKRDEGIGFQFPCTDLWLCPFLQLDDGDGVRIGFVEADGEGVPQ